MSNVRYTSYTGDGAEGKAQATLAVQNHRKRNEKARVVKRGNRYFVQVYNASHSGGREDFLRE